MVRVTLRLAEDLHRRLRAQSERNDVSLNQCIIAAVQSALERDVTTGQGEESLLQEVRNVRGAMGELVISLNFDRLPPPFYPPMGLADSDAIRESSPTLAPPLSTTVIADRTDRI